MAQYRSISTAHWLVSRLAWIGFGSSLGLLLLFSQESAAALAVRLALVGPGDMPALLSPGRLAVLRVGLGIGCLLTLVIGLSGGLRIAGRRPSHPSWWPSWPPLSRTQGRVGRALVVMVGMLHVWLAFFDPLSFDEAFTYRWFMQPGPVVAASYYPFPNNHVLLSVLGATLQQLLPGAGPLVVLRLLPTLLGLAVLPLSYCLLLRSLRFGTATLVWGLFNLAPATATAAVTGRGYGLVLVALWCGLAASLVLLRPAASSTRLARRGAWLLFVVSGVLGLYTVPTHLYGVLGLLVGLSIGFARGPWRRARLQLLHLVLVSVGMAGLVALLYAPVLAVTGWSALLANPYVRALPACELARQLVGGYPAQVAGVLLGWPGMSVALFGVVVLGGPVLLAKGRLPAPASRLGWLAYAQLVGWVVLALAQRVLPPARVLLAEPLFLLLILGLAGEWAWVRIPSVRWFFRSTLSKLLIIGLILASVASYRLGHYFIASALPRRQQNGRFQRAYAWLRGQPPRPVLVERLPLAVYWQYEAAWRHQVPLPLRLVADAASEPLSRGGYRVLSARPTVGVVVYDDQDLFIVQDKDRPSRPLR